MKKFAVFSGFLGSGKTTAMMTLTKYFTEHHGKAAMISNDLGGEGLADNRLAALNDCRASELTGACICYQTENLVARLKELFEDGGCELVLSDIPGFGVGALDHVYHTLDREFPGQFPLAPFTVLAEPERVASLMEENGGELSYILGSQLAEADLIVLNKCDLLTREEKQDYLDFLSRRCPDAAVIGISALTGEALEALSQQLIQGSASMRRPDIGYGSAEFLSAMGKFSEYNSQYYAIVCCDTFDGNAYLKDLADKIAEDIRNVPGEIPHLKLLAWEPQGDYGKVDLLGTQRPVEVSREFLHPCQELAVVLNTSAMCPSKTLGTLITTAIETVSEAYKLSIMVYKKECFGAMEDANG